MEQKPVTGRFAPSPSGRMHLGNLWSALLAWLSARSQGGEMVLRLEDLDPDRCTRAWCDQVMRDLEWLGLTWDNEPVYQSERTAVYAEAFMPWRSGASSTPATAPGLSVWPPRRLTAATGRPSTTAAAPG